MVAAGAIAGGGSAMFSYGAQGLYEGRKVDATELGAQVVIGAAQGAAFAAAPRIGQWLGERAAATPPKPPVPATPKPNGAVPPAAGQARPTLEAVAKKELGPGEGAAASPNSSSTARGSTAAQMADRASVKPSPSLSQTPPTAAAPDASPSPSAGDVPVGGGVTTDVVYHYTTEKASAQIQAKGLFSQSSATDKGTYTAQEAVELLGVKPPVEVVVEVRNAGQFIPNKPPIVQPHPLGPGGGVDLTNPKRVAAKDILSVRPVRKP